MTRHYLLAASVAATLLLSACNHDAPDRMASLVAFRQTESIIPQWAVKIGHGTAGNYLRLNPALSYNDIYATDFHGHIMDINRCNGRIIWHTEVDNDVTSGVGLGSGKVVVGGHNGHVYALRQSDGRIMWDAHVPGEVLATPAVSHNIAFVKTANGKLLAFNATTGKILWRYQIQNPSLILRGDSAVVTYGKWAIAGFADGSVVAFDKQTGRKAWEHQLAVARGVSPVERMVDITSNLKAEAGVLYVTSYQGRIAALRISNGRPLWQREFSAHAGLTVGPNAVYATDSNSHVWAFAKRNGQVLWHNDGLNGRDVTGPALVRSNIVVGDKRGYVHLLDAEDGHFVARVRIDGGRIDTAPVARSSSVYVYSDRGELMAYRVG